METPIKRIVNSEERSTASFFLIIIFHIILNVFDCKCFGHFSSPLKISLYDKFNYIAILCLQNVKSERIYRRCFWSLAAAFYFVFPRKRVNVPTTFPRSKGKGMVEPSNFFFSVLPFFSSSCLLPLVFVRGNHF